jgi:hypothetical protein
LDIARSESLIKRAYGLSSETRGEIDLAARRIMHRAVRLPPVVYVVMYLADPLDYLNDFFRFMSWPLLRGLFLRGPTPLDCLCNPGAAFRRQVPLLLGFRGFRYVCRQSAFGLARPTGLPWSGAACRVSLQQLARFFQSRNFCVE